ncbi:uncharacterized protein LOC124615705 [Schistocerca americana]|uniref:uncharacterized protein LOC124615705 n=1 Tax=Schistocerca americana TaxID=7009 RepID=UPI001F4F857B|nr:uncharacterized protein LOC124615705 [Schistocerca americana]
MSYSSSLCILFKGLEFVMVKELVPLEGDYVCELVIKLVQTTEEDQYDLNRCLAIEATYKNNKGLCFDIYEFMGILHGTEHFMTVLQAKIGGPCIIIHLTDDSGQSVTYSCTYCTDKGKWITNNMSQLIFHPCKLLFQLPVLIQEENVKEMEYKIINYLQKLCIFKQHILVSFILDGRTITSTQFSAVRDAALRLGESSLHLHVPQLNVSFSVTMAVSAYSICREELNIGVLEKKRSFEDDDGHLHISVLGLSASVFPLDVHYWQSLLEASLPDDITLSDPVMICNDYCNKLPSDWCHTLQGCKQTKTVCVFITFELDKSETICSTDLQKILEGNITVLIEQNKSPMTKLLKKALNLFLSTPEENINSSETNPADVQFCDIMASSLVNIIYLSLDDEFQEKCLQLLKASYKKEAEDTINKKLKELIGSDGNIM